MAPADGFLIPVRRDSFCRRVSRRNAPETTHPARWPQRDGRMTWYTARSKMSRLQLPA
jgi:hypothetical protein